MTRILTIIALLFAAVQLTGCAERISVDPLPQNVWAEPDSNGKLTLKFIRLPASEVFPDMQMSTKESEYAPEELTLEIFSFTENTCLTCSKDQRKIQMSDLSWMDFDRCADRHVTEKRSIDTSNSRIVEGEVITFYDSETYEVNVVKKRAANLAIISASKSWIRNKHAYLVYAEDTNILYHVDEWSNENIASILNDRKMILVALTDYCRNRALYGVLNE